MATSSASGESGIIVGRPWRDPGLDAAVDAVVAGDLAAGVTLLRESGDDPDRRTQRADALGRAAAENSRGVRALADADADDPDLQLWLGTTLTHEAWRARGELDAPQTHGIWLAPGELIADLTPEQRLKDFLSILTSARDPLMAAARTLPADPAPWAMLLRYARGMRLGRDEQREIWNNVESRHPLHYQASAERVEGLAAKWGGSHEEMLDFARSVAAKAPPGHPLAAMIAVAHFEVAVAEDTSAFGRDPVRRHFRDDAARREVAAASDRWLSAQTPHPYDIDAHHIFGYVFDKARDRERARTHLAATGDRASEMPWSYFTNDVAAAVARARRRLKIG